MSKKQTPGSHIADPCKVNVLGQCFTILYFIVYNMYNYKQSHNRNHVEKKHTMQHNSTIQKVKLFIWSVLFQGRKLAFSS